MRNLIKLLWCLVTAALVACGGGGGSSGSVAGAAPGTVQALFTTAPSSTTLNAGAAVSYQIGGGTAPYGAASDSPANVSVAVSGTTLTLSALQGGSVGITITDSVGAKISLSVSVPLPGALFSNAPGAITIVKGSNAIYQVGGGVAPYSAVSASPANVSAVVTGNSLVIVGLLGGQSAVSVVDSKGARLTIAVTVPLPDALFTTAPSSLTLLNGSSVSYQIGGGTQPYVAVSSIPGTLRAVVDGNALTLTALQGGNVAVSVVDARGQTLVLSVSVPLPGALFSTAPSAVTVAVGMANTFSIGGGTAPYFATSSNTSVARAVISGTSGSLLEITGLAAGAATVQVSDSNGGVISVNVTVPALSSLITTAPAGLVLGAGQSAEYLVSGGSSPYSVTSSNAAVVNGTVSAAGKLVISAISSGAANVVIGDSQGRTVSVNVTVSSVFYTTAPSTISMSAGTSQTFQVVGGVQPYGTTSSDIRVAVGNVSGSAITIAAVSKGTATVQLLDATGKTIPITVIVDGSSGTSSVAAIEILASGTSLSSAQGSKMTFIVTAKDGLNTAVPAQQIAFSASSGILTGANPSPVTDASGAIVSVALSPGADQSNRTITVSANVGTIFKTINIPIVGTKLTVAGAGSLLSTAGPQKYTVTSLDSSGRAISGAAITLSSLLGNTVSPQTVTTDSSGSALVNYTPTNAGTDTLTATGLGTTGTATIAISAQNFAFTAPAVDSKIAVGNSTPVTVQYLNSGVGVAGLAVTFSTTRGTLSVSSGTTDANGLATTTISSPTAGPVTISAQQGTARTTLSASFIAVTPATVVLQANPSSVLPNTTTSTSSASTLSATVRDATGNPVSGAIVNFTAITDGSNGSIEPGSTTTSADGVATVAFKPGALSTATNGVRIRATVNGTLLTSDALLTVNGSALFISIGVSNVLGVPDNVTYEKEFQVYVTDANGSPAANRSVVVSVLPDVYRKGFLEYSVANTKWGFGPASAPVVTTCANEDANSDGILQPGEDLNGNGKLDPGNPVVINPGTVTTDSTGFGKFTLRYGKNYALWVNTVIKARSSVGGTESSATQSYLLEMLFADAASASTPANVLSPFGKATICTDPN